MRLKQYDQALDFQSSVIKAETSFEISQRKQLFLVVGVV